MMSQSTKNNITVEELLCDRKTDEEIRKIINGTKTDDSVSLVMRFFATDKSKFPINDYGRHETELESKKYNEDIYKKLEWDKEKHFDVINSFWTVFSWAMHSEFPEIYQVANAGNVRIYKNDYLRGRDRKLIYESFPKCFIKEEELRNRVTTLSKHFEDINNLAAYVHTVANFMPCPEGFNVPKMSAQITQGNKTLCAFDFLPLMIDLIEECCTTNTPMRYTQKDGSIPCDTLLQWRTWFLQNREKYCLEDYYSIHGEIHIEGIPLFANQSLKYPVPRSKDEVAQCLDEMVKRIKTRAYRLYDKYGKPNGQNI